MESLTGNRIKEKRQSLGMTVQELAEKIGLHVQSVYKYENGRACPSNLTLCCIADVLHTSLDWLCGREEYIMLRTVEAVPKHERLLQEAKGNKPLEICEDCGKTFRHAGQINSVGPAGRRE